MPQQQLNSNLSHSISEPLHVETCGLVNNNSSYSTPKRVSPLGRRSSLQRSESSEDEMPISPLGSSSEESRLFRSRICSGSTGIHLDSLPEGEEKPASRVSSRQWSQPIVEKWRRCVRRVLTLDDPWEKFRIIDYPTEECLRHRYSSLKKKWVVDKCRVKMEPEPFDRGAMRACFRLKKLPSRRTNDDDWSGAMNYVAKRYIADVEHQTYFEDVRLQMDAKLWGEEYNRHNPPKKVDIFQVSILEFIERPEKPLYHLEHFIEGHYTKYNSNSGFVTEQARMTPQAFSHFTFERSGHLLIVVDIQGVGDLYTDPQVHTSDGIGYGDGNLGTKGMALFFHSHQCNDICSGMGLSLFDLSPTEKAELKKQKAKGPQRKTTTVLRNHLSMCISAPSGTVSSAETVMEYLRNRSYSTCSDDHNGSEEDHNDAFMDTYVNGSQSVFHADSEISLRSSADSAISVGGRRSPVIRFASLDDDPPARMVRKSGSRMRYDSELDSACSSISITQEHEKEAYWEEMRKQSRPSCILSEEDQQKLLEIHHELTDVSERHSVLGQIHLDLSRYHELGRFVDAEAPYDRAAAWFHLEIAANCGVLEAVLTMAKIYLGLPHELLADFSIGNEDDDDEEKADNIDRGLELLRVAGESGDRGSMLHLAHAYETGIGLGSQEGNPDWVEAIKWYRHAAHTEEVDEDGTYDATMDNPTYEILAKMAEMYRKGLHGLQKDPVKAGDLYNQAAEAATEAMKGKMANKYYMLAEETFAEAEE